MPMVIEGPVLPQQGGRPRTSMDTLLVRVDTDGDVTGWGEGFGHRIFPATKAALDTLIGPMCVGRDPTAITALMDELQRNLTGVGRNGPAMYALSAIDIALWDIAGKLAGLPLYRLLGGSPRKTLPAYASLLRYGEPDAVTHYVERALKRGYRYIKLHEITVEPIRAAREAAGPDVAIMVDCNCAWSVGEAIGMAHRFMPFNLKWLEEPVWPPEDHVGLARVQTQGGIPTAAGENAMLPEFKGMLEAGAITYAQPSVTKMGGVTQMRRVMALADAFGITVVPHSAYFGPGLIASIHCIAALSGGSLVERYDADFAVNPMHDAILPDKNGCLAVPQGPGLGVEPDPTVIAKLRVG
jgi:D-galactarolactone cycloisomerase